MSSKINGLGGASTNVGAGRRASKSRDAAGDSSSAASSPAGENDVHITGSANLLSTLAQQLHTLPAVDEARVAQFRSAIEGGSYTVQPGNVADQLLQLEQSLAGITGG